MSFSKDTPEIRVATCVVIISDLSEFIKNQPRKIVKWVHLDAQRTLNRT